VDGRGRFEAIEDLCSRLKLLAQSVEDSKWNKDAKSKSQREERPGVRKVEIPLTYQRLTLRYHDHPERTRYTEYVADTLERYDGSLGFATPELSEASLASLPEHSFILYIPFTLSQPYISKDDTSFYVHENPVCKEWVIRVPMVRGTSWKGSFRSALRRTLNCDDDDPRIACLMGNSKEQGEEENQSQRGRLGFFPTFFDRLEVGVINPHSRETGAGQQPIHIEAVPRKATGVFALLYSPIIAGGQDIPLPGWRDVLKDLESVGKATYSLLAQLGFGAKTASGMGRAREGIPGSYLLVHRWLEVSPQLPPPPLPEQPSDTFQPQTDEFLDDNGCWPYYATKEELEASIPGNVARKRYKKERLLYRSWLKQREKWEAWEHEVNRLRQQAKREMVRVDLEQLEDLKNLRERVEAVVEGGPDE